MEAVTTIAYKDGILCTDRQATAGVRRTLCEKLWIVRGKGVAVAVTGSLSAGIRFCGWLEQGGDKDKWQLDEDTEIVVLNLDTGKVVAYDSNMVPMPVFDKFDAWGSGSDLAIGAMEAGVDAVKAVEIAAKHDTGTGNGLAVINLNKDNKVRKYANWRNWKSRQR
jgi:hypothetical protein